MDPVPKHEDDYFGRELSALDISVIATYLLGILFITGSVSLQRWRAHKRTPAGQVEAGDSGGNSGRPRVASNEG